MSLTVMDLENQMGILPFKYCSMHSQRADPAMQHPTIVIFCRFSWTGSRRWPSA